MTSTNNIIYKSHWLTPEKGVLHIYYACIHEENWNGVRIVGRKFLNTCTPFYGEYYKTEEDTNLDVR